MGRSDKTLPFPTLVSKQERSVTKSSKYPTKGLLHEKLISFISKLFRTPSPLSSSPFLVNLLELNSSFQ